MKLDFTVLRVSETTVSAPVKLGEETVVASVPALEVELGSAHNHSGAYTHRFIGSDVDEAKKKFVAGETVSWSL